MYDLEDCHEELQDAEDERDEWKARADALAAEVERLGAENAALRAQLKESSDFVKSAQQFTGLLQFEMTELQAENAALRAAGEQEKKYELGRLALLAGVVADDEVSAHEMSEQIAQAIITLRAQLEAIGDGWEVPDGVEYPVGRVEVLVVRPAIWRDYVEEWEDTRTDYYLSGVIAYRDVQPAQE